MPVSKKQCIYRSKTINGNNNWYKCSDTARRQQQRRGSQEIIFDFTKGIGEIVEDGGKKYHAFSTIIEFSFR
ncbi:MAG: hypothetical protein ACKO5Q_05420 [Microcystaceae cyanobacterium]